MTHTQKTTLFILGVASVLGAAWLIRQRRAGTADFSNWQRSLAVESGEKIVNVY
jgi:hypothetical protein